MTRAPKEDAVEVSVIIPALEATPHVLRIVRLLAEQEQDFGFEILLVLNHAPRTLDAVLPPRARILFCETPGSFAARNAGIAAARGRVLAFTDSDVTPAADWLAEGDNIVSLTGGNMVVAGRIVPYYERRNSVALYESAFYFRQEHYVRMAGFGSTANLWVPARIIDKIGAFDETMLGAADVEFGNRAKGRGIVLTYAESLVVSHAARHELSDLLKKERRLVGGEVLLDRKLGGRSRKGLRAELVGFFRRSRLIGKVHPLPGGLKLQFVACSVLAARLFERIAMAFGKAPVAH